MVFSGEQTIILAFDDRIALAYSLSDRQIWTLALFLRHMDKLLLAVQQTWQQVENWPVTSVD